MHISRTPVWLQATKKYQPVLHLAEKMKLWHPTLYTHAVNVACLTHDIAINLDVQGSDLEQVIQGAFFHDLGKIAWPGQLVSKKQLDKNDWQIIRKHPIMGEYYLRDYLPETPDLVFRIIREHHERPDGGGYPNGLKAKGIHSLSLLVSTVEVYVALTENRSYRLGWCKNDALIELKRQGFPEEIINLIRKNNTNIYRCM